MPTIDTVVIGAGHAGLAVSRLLTEARVDHVVLDRGRVAERWRTERWDSLHLLTPAWMTHLPHFQAAGTDPDAFIGAGAFVEHLDQYAACPRSFTCSSSSGDGATSATRRGWATRWSANSSETDPRPHVGRRSTRHARLIELDDVGHQLPPPHTWELVVDTLIELQRPGAAAPVVDNC